MHQTINNSKSKRKLNTTNKVHDLTSKNKWKYKNIIQKLKIIKQFFQIKQNKYKNTKYFISKSK